MPQGDWREQVELLTVEEFKNLQGEYPYRRILYHSMRPVEHCKVEIHADCVLGTLKVPGGNQAGKNEQVCGFYLRGDKLLLIEDGQMLLPLIRKIEKNDCGASGAEQILLMVFELLIANDMLYLGQQEEMLAGMEEGLLKKIPEHFHEKIIAYRKRLCAYHMYYEQLLAVGEKMQMHAKQLQSGEGPEGISWQFYIDQVGRLHRYVEFLREYLVQIRDLYQSLIDVEQNKVMRILTVVTTIFLPLSLIAGWYGMNFPYMPEFRYQGAYYVVLIVSVGIVIIEFIFFHKKKIL